MVGPQVGSIHLGAVAELVATNIDNRGSVGMSVDRQGNGIAQLDVFTHCAAHRGLGLGIFHNVDHVVASDNADGDVCMGRVRVKVDRAAGSGKAKIARRIAGDDQGVNFVVTTQVVGIHFYLIPEHSIGVHGGGCVFVPIDQQGDCVAYLYIATHSAAHKGLGLCVFSNVDHVVASNDADGDSRCGRREVKADRTAGSGFCGVACRVIGHNLGVDAAVCPQIEGSHVGFITQHAVVVDNGGGVGVAVDGKGDGIASLDIAAHRAAHQGSQVRAFNYVDHIIACDHANGNASSGGRSINIDGTAGSSLGRVASRVGGYNLGINAVVGRKIRGGHLGLVTQHTVGADNRGGVGVTVDGKGNGVANLDITAHLAAHKGCFLGAFNNVQHIVASDDANGNARFGGGNVHTDLAGGRSYAWVTRFIIGYNLGVNVVVVQKISRADTGLIAEHTVTKVNH